jgi:DNA-binding NarL/FixJ family response regulator
MDREVRTVLIADGDEGWRGRTAAALGRAGYQTREVGTGAAALEVVREHAIALVLLEVSLPDMTGYEICCLIREERGKDLPVFFLSGIRTEPLDRVAGLLLGADDFIVKPYDADELVARVRRFVSRTTAAREVNTARRGPKLTQRETEVLGLLIEGRRQKEIAAQLVIREKTVATHIQNLLGKFGVHSRAELLAHGFRLGFAGGGYADVNFTVAAAV